LSFAGGFTFELEDRHQVATYKKLPLDIDRGEGVWVYTSGGERYLDLYGGHAVASTGHAHPRVVAAISSQAARLIFYSNAVYNAARSRAAKKLLEIAPEPLSKVFFVNSGTEANESAMFLARRATGRLKIISFEGGFHGRTPGSISATGLDKYRRLALTSLPGHTIVPFGDIAAVERAIDQDTAAVILEPIQSMSGVRMAAADFYRELGRLCDRAGSLLIYDEVQTGMGRTGEFFFAGRFGVVPDMVTLAKGMASGIPMGAVLMSDRVARSVEPGDLGSTFGGGPLASAALEATIDVMREEKLLDNVRQNSSYLFAQLSRIPTIEQVRGLGYLIGIRFRSGNAAPYQQALIERKIITGLSEDPAVLRLLPPLTLRRPEIDLFLEELSTIRGEP
jgi:acetylornithine/succinyldiaminopimelate/putrescine aminotransferase